MPRRANRIERSIKIFQRKWMCARVMLFIFVYGCFSFILASRLHLAAAAAIATTTTTTGAYVTKKMWFDSPQSIINKQWKWNGAMTHTHTHTASNLSSKTSSSSFFLFVCVYLGKKCNQRIQRNGKKNIGIDLNALAKCQRPQSNRRHQLFYSFVMRGTNMFAYLNCGFTVR